MARETIWHAIWRTNRKIPVALGILLLFNIAFFVYLVYVLEVRVERLEREYISQQADVREAEQGGRSAESPLVLYARGIADLKRFRGAIPPKEELTGLVGEVFRLAESSGLSIDRISYDPEMVDEMRLLRYGLDFVVSGNYNQVKKFAHKIEQSDRLVAIDEMALASQKKEKGVTLKLALTTYFRADKS